MPAAERKGLNYGDEKDAPVDKYEERPYLDALTKEHAEVLKEAHQLPARTSKKEDDK